MVKNGLFLQIKGVNNYGECLEQLIVYIKEHTFDELWFSSSPFYSRYYLKLTNLHR
jgi:hypothetical protein